MDKTPTTLLDEILAETRSYRCEYLQVLIEKYVNTQDEVVDIHIQNLSITKPTNYLKRIKEKPFGYVSSYECKSAKKTIKCWKKKVILQRKACFRKYVGSLSPADHPANLKYLSTDKVSKTLSVYSDKSYEEGESTLLNETEFDTDDETIAFSEEEETILLDKDSSILSDTVVFPSENIQNEISPTDEPIKTLATKDKYSNSTSSAENGDERNSFRFICNGSNNTLRREYFLSKLSPKFKFSNIGQEISKKNNQISVFHDTKSLPYSLEECIKIFEIKHRKICKEIPDKNALVSCDCTESVSHCSTKFFKSKSEKVELMASGKNCQSFNDCNSKLSCSSSNSNASKVWSRKDKMTASNEECQIVSDNNTKPLSSTSNRDNQYFKLSSREVEKVIFDRNCQMSSDYNAKPLCSSNKSTPISILGPTEDGKVVTNKNCQFDTNCNFQSSNEIKKSIENPKSKSKEQTSNNNSGVSNNCDSESLSYASSKPYENTNFKSKEGKNPPSKKDYEKFSNTKSNASNKPVEVQKLKSKKDGIVASNVNIKPCKVLISKLPYEMSNCNQVYVLSSKDDETLMSNKNDQTSSSDNAKSLFSLSDKSVKDLNVKSKEDGKQTFNENCKISKKSIQFSTLKQRLDEKLISDGNYKKSNIYNAKLLSTAQDCRATEAQKLRSKESEMTTHESCEILGISSSVLSSSNSKKSNQLPKIKSVEESTEKCLEASNVNNASSTSVKHSRHKYSDVRTRTSNKNRQALLNSFSLRCTSFSSSFGSNLGVSVEIDPLCLKSVSDKKKSVAQSPSSLKKSKSYKKYLEENVKIDDLSIRDLSSPVKTHKNRQK